MKCEAAGKLERTKPGMLKPQTDERENFYRSPCPRPKPHPSASITEPHEHARKAYTPPIPHTLTLYSVQLATAMHHCHHGCLVRIWRRVNLSCNPSEGLCGSKRCLMLHLLRVWTTPGMRMLERDFLVIDRQIKENQTAKGFRFHKKLPNSRYQISSNENILYILTCCQIR